MYQGLLYAIKRRMLDEIELAFQDHPAFNEKVKVYHKFPYQERVQYGVVLRNTSASQMRMSPDNYLSELISHVRMAKQTTYPGLAIEWVRENPVDVTNYVTDENVSSQLGPTQRMFRTARPILSGPGNTAFAKNIGQIDVKVNGTKVLPEFVDGEKGVVVLRTAPASGDTVTISYWFRRIVDPGIYVIDFIEDNMFLVAPIYTVYDELVIDSTTGTETTASLDHQDVNPGSDYLTIKYKNSTVPIPLVRGTDYSLDYPTGVITFLQPLGKNFQLFAEYLWQPTNYVNGPYTVEPYQENHEVLPGVVISIGRRAKKGDRQAIIVTKFREPQARIYGGHWTMSLDLAVIAKDPAQMEEMAEQVINWLWAERKNELEYEGITLNSVEPTGESEESFVESTGDVYYTTSISVSIQTEWQKFIPFLYKIRNIVPDIEIWPGAKNYVVYNDYTLAVNSLEPDTRPVMVYPTAGYEKLT